ncbi:MAG TPA: hypothetical protein H9902_04455, partial [Candidatus Stackebrandtia faecavium]|nr:hypothetical protein [Candidatus Stackebrandtia faecavium]
GNATGETDSRRSGDWDRRATERNIRVRHFRPLRINARAEPTLAGIEQEDVANEPLRQGVTKCSSCTITSAEKR